MFILAIGNVIKKYSTLLIHEELRKTFINLRVFLVVELFKEDCVFVCAFVCEKREM